MAEAMQRESGDPWTQPEIVTAVRRALGVADHDDSFKLSQANVSKLCRGEVMRSDYFPHIAHVLGVNAFWLATGKGEKRPAQQQFQPRHAALLRTYLALPQDLRRPIRALIETSFALLNIEKTAELNRQLAETDQRLRLKREAERVARATLTRA
jgi:hypothetical protein